MANPKVLRQLAFFAAAGTEVAVYVVGGCWGGYWLDGRFKTQPFLTLAGSLAGVSLAAYRLWQAARSLSEPDETRDKSRKD